jgi:hypothetical protein
MAATRKNKRSSARQSSGEKAKKRPSAKRSSSSLVSPSGIGGLLGGKGYDYQSRYITCRVPRWLLNKKFKAILHEGTGDVDVLFGTGKKEHREHIQIKNHPVTTKAEFQEIIEAFGGFDRSMKGTYERFVLACPSVGPLIQPLKNSLERLRDAQPFFRGAAAGSLKATISDVKNRIRSLGLSGYQTLILNKVHFDVRLADFDDDKSACNNFASTLLDHPEYKERLFRLIKPAYQPLFQEVTNHRGKVLNRLTLKRLIDAALESAGSMKEPAIDLDIHNWTVGKYDRKPKYVIDWSTLFNRDQRIVPRQKTWNQQLIPELYALKRKLALADARTIRLRGKIALTTGIALGAAFPQIDDWIFEILQPPQVRPWRSDAPPNKNYPLQLGPEIPIDRSGNSIALVFSIKGSAVQDVADYIRGRSLPVKAIVPVAPRSGAGALSIGDDREAVSLALIARDEHRKALERHGVRTTHLFFYGPLALSVFVGQLFTSVGRVQLYEFTDPGYAPSALIRT